MHNKIDSKLVLNTLIQHETLTIDDLTKKENIGVLISDTTHLRLQLEELKDNGYLEDLAGVTPLTYTITKKGIDEGVRLKKLQ